MSKNKLIMLIGLPGSGKSTFAREMKAQGIEVVSSDKIREEFFGGIFSFKTNDEIFGIAQGKIADALLNGKDVILDATNLTRWGRKDNLFGVWGSLSSKGAANLEYDTECIVINTPYLLCRFYNSIREVQCPDESIQSMYWGFQYPAKEEGFQKITEIYRTIDKEIVAGYTEEQKEEMRKVLVEILQSQARINRPFSYNMETNLDIALTLEMLGVNPNDMLLEIQNAEKGRKNTP